MNDENLAISVSENDEIKDVQILGADGTPVQSAPPSTDVSLIPDDRIAGFVNQVAREMFKKLAKKIQKSDGQADIRFLAYYIGSVMRAYMDGIEQDILNAEKIDHKIDLYKFLIQGFVKAEDE